VAGVAALAAAPAGAHTGLASSTPTNGAKVAALPAVVTLRFRQRAARIGTIRVLRGRRDHTARVVRVRGDGRTIRVRTRTLARGARGTPPPRRALRGRVRVVWNVRAADGHRQRGVVRFRVR